MASSSSFRIYFGSQKKKIFNIILLKLGKIKYYYNEYYVALLVFCLIMMNVHTITGLVRVINDNKIEIMKSTIENMRVPTLF